MGLLYLFRADTCFPEAAFLTQRFPLIPFGAIILSQLFYGEDSFITLIAHNPIGSNLAESPPVTVVARLCQED